MTGHAFVTGARTHVGRVRRENEDSYAALPQIGVWAVADGMGGYAAGKHASLTVTRGLGEIEPTASAQDLLRRFEAKVSEANAALRRFGEEHGITTFGTTLAALLVAESLFACVWCGDSRVYRLRDGVLRQLTRDHTEVQALVDEGQISAEQARHWPGRNVITRAIAVCDDPMLEIETGRLADGDVFLLCSDGLTGCVLDGELKAALASLPPEECCGTLIDLALERGGPDNVTVLVVHCRLDGTGA